MLDDRSDHLIRALSGLKSAEKGMSQWSDKGDYPEVLGTEYSLAIDHLGHAGFDVDEFRLPTGAIARNVARTGGQLMVDGPTLRALVTKAISYFELSEAVKKVVQDAQRDPSGLIGFQASLPNRG